MNVGDIMEKSSKTVGITDDVESALELMRAEGLEAITVIGPDGEVAGLLWYSSIEKIVSENALDEALEETFLPVTRSRQLRGICDAQSPLGFA